MSLVPEMCGNTLLGISQTKRVNLNMMITTQITQSPRAGGDGDVRQLERKEL